MDLYKTKPFVNTKCATLKTSSEITDYEVRSIPYKAHKSSYGEPFPVGFNWTSLVESLFYLLFAGFHYRENHHLHNIFKFLFQINNHSSTAASPAGIKAKISNGKQNVNSEGEQTHSGTRGISLLFHADDTTLVASQCP